MALWFRTSNTSFFCYIFYYLYHYNLVIYKLFWSFWDYKKSKLNWEIIDLKSQLQDWQSKLIDSINNNFKEVLDEFRTTNDTMILKYKKENEKVLSNLEYEIKSIKDKIK